MRTLVVVLAIQFVIAAVFVTLVATGTLFGGADSQSDPRPAAVHKVDRFDADYAWGWLVRQVRIGPRPAGSPQSRRLAEQIRRALPGGRFQAVPKGLRNVVGTTPGRDPARTVVVAAHYDTKDIKGFVGANDGAGGVATLIALARSVKPRTFGPTIVWLALDGEESPGADDGSESDFEKRGIRGAKVAAPRYKGAEAMILLDFVADKQLLTPRESNSDIELWAKLRAAARAVGTARYYPDDTQGPISDDHIPFLKQGIPSIDLIDFNFPCWHMTCDNLSAVSRTSLDVSGETVRELLASL
jgi:glutaminyl-peptide cyclotransferase